LVAAKTGCYNSGMAIYSEPGSGCGNSTAMLIERAPDTDREETSATYRKRQCRVASKKFLPPAQPKDELAAGTCPRCGCIAKHATPSDCIDQLRDALAEATSAPLLTRQEKLRGAK